jgi:hypothetical protein
LVILAIPNSVSGQMGSPSCSEVLPLERAVAEGLRAAWPEVGETGDVLLGSKSGCLVKIDCGHCISPFG